MPAPDLGPPAVVPIPVADGPARLETYTILYDREGAPERGIAIGRLGGGERFIAHTPPSRAELEAFAAAEQVGRRGRVRHRDGLNLFEPE